MRLISGWMASSINKICLIGQTANHTHCMSHHCSTKKIRVWCGLWAVLLRWWSRPAHYCEWESLLFNDNRICLAPIGRYGLGEHVLATGRRHKPHSECHNQFIESQVWRTCYRTKWSSRLAASVVRFDAVRLFPVRLHQVYGEVYNELHTNIKREIAAVSADFCLKIVKNWVQRLDCCKRASGGQAKEIEFHS